ncbi:MAG: tail fiber protein, partial [Clostridia bacterium]|nr:tail fiber protein [Clostridia bacterium]
EIWLEGSTVSRTTYANLFAIYGTTYGAGDGSTTFKLPDFRNRAIWGADNYGYVAAGIPSLTATTSSAGSHTHTKGSMRIVGSLLSSDDDEALVYADNITATGALRTGETKSNFPSPAPDVLGNVRQKIDFDTDRSGSWSGSTSSAGSHTHPITVELSTSGIMGNSTTIQPPSIKVRVKTRYQ